MIAWICTNDSGEIDFASAIDYTDPSELRELFNEGRRPKLIEADKIIFLSPVPADARVLMEYAPHGRRHECAPTLRELVDRQAGKIP